MVVEALAMLKKRGGIIKTKANPELIRFTGTKLKTLMRKHKITIDILAKKTGISRKKIRELRSSKFIDKLWARDLVQAVTKKDPGSKYKNPKKPIARGVARRKAIIQAEKKFRDFHGDVPSSVNRVVVRDAPNILYTLGEIESITYNADRDGDHDRFVHNFRKRSRPLLTVTKDGKKLYLIGGSYSVTDRGIVDR